MNEPRVDIRLLERLKAHLESREILGVGIGDGHDVLEFLARLPMGDVEVLLPSGLDDQDRRTVLRLIEHRKGQLQEHELPESEARARGSALEAMRRRAAERKKGRGFR
jgi:hypothetical protein